MNILQTIEQFSDRTKTLWLLGLAFALYFPLVFCLYGADQDSYGVIEITGRTLLEEHRYEPSRNPGFIVHEAPTAYLNLWGGYVLSNVGTVLMSLWALYSFLKLCEYYKISHRFLLTATLAFQPLYWTNATSTIDYVWALALFFAAWRLFIHDRFVLAGLVFGLAGGARVLMALPAGAVFIAYFLTKEKPFSGIAQSAGIALGVALLCYLPSFASAHYTAGFLRMTGGNFPFFGAVARFVYKNIYFWGLQTALCLVFFAPSLYRGFLAKLKTEYRTVVLIAALCIGFYEAFFFRLPTENEYMLPILPMFLMILGITLAEKRRWLIVFFLVQSSYNVVSFNIARGDAKNHASTAHVGLWIERGYLIDDTLTRLEPEVVLEQVDPDLRDSILKHLAEERKRSVENYFLGK